MVCKNKKKISKSQNGWGIGIENAKIRLDSYYKEKFQLRIDDKELSFTLSLTIDL